MIRVNGTIKFRLDFDLKIDMTEEQWDAIPEWKQNEYIDDRVKDFESMEMDYCDVWEVNTIKEDLTNG